MLTIRWYLQEAICCLVQTMISWGTAVAPSLSTMKVLISSPCRSWGMPMTATRDTAGWVISFCLLGLLKVKDGVKFLVGDEEGLVVRWQRFFQEEFGQPVVFFCQTRVGVECTLGF